MSKGNHRNEAPRDMTVILSEIGNARGDQGSEIHELQRLVKELEGKDFSEDSNKKRVYDKTVMNMKNHGGEKTMKKFNKRVIATAASLLIVGFAFTQTSLAKSLADRIVNSIDLGNIKVVQVEIDKSQQKLILDRLKGKVFDKDGNPITDVSAGEKMSLYTAKGEEISRITPDGKIITVAEDNKDKAETVTVTDASKVNGNTSFKVKLPTYLPSGYKFKKADFYKDENGKISKDYIDIYFWNQQTGKEIFMQQRAMNGDTAYITSTEKSVELEKINGADAIVSGGGNIDWEANNVLYGISCNGNLSKAQLIKLAESVR